MNFKTFCVSVVFLTNCSFLGKKVSAKKEEGSRSIASACAGSKLGPDLGFFRKIPVGKFRMGSSLNERFRHRDEKQVLVEISQPFEIMETEGPKSSGFV